MTTQNDELLARLARLETQHASYHSLFLQLQNRELVLRAAVMAMIYQLPPGALKEDFSMFLDQIASALPPHLQQSEYWSDVTCAVEGARTAPTVD